MALCRISSSGLKFPGWCFAGTYRRWSENQDVLDKNGNENILKFRCNFWRLSPQIEKKLPEAKSDWQAGLANREQMVCKKVFTANYPRNYFN